MPNQTQSDLAVAPLKPLAWLTLVIAVSGALPISQSINARGMGITSPNEDRMTLKNILEWVFAGAAVMIVSSVFISRTLFLRARNRPLRDFFAFIESPQQEGGPSQGLPRPGPLDLALMPSDRQTRERTQATDIDSEGRRGGGPDPDDPNGDLTEKDVLPAYEVKGGPPNYSQFLAVDLGTSTNARLQITETVPVGRSQSLELLEPRSGTSDQSVQTSPVLDVRLPHLPPPSYGPGTATSNPDISHPPDR